MIPCISVHLRSLAAAHQWSPDLLNACVLDAELQSMIVLEMVEDQLLDEDDDEDDDDDDDDDGVCGDDDHEAVEDEEDDIIYVTEVDSSIVLTDCDKETSWIAAGEETTVVDDFFVEIIKRDILHFERNTLIGSIVREVRDKWIFLSIYPFSFCL